MCFARGQPLADGGLAVGRRDGARRPAGRSPRTARPSCSTRARRARPEPRSCSPSRSSLSAISRWSCALSVSASRGSNSRPRSPSSSASSYSGRRDDHGHGAAGDRTQHVLRRRRGAGRGRDGDLRAGEVLRLRAVRRPGERDAVAQGARQRHRAEVVGQPRPDRRVPRQRAPAAGAARGGRRAASCAPPRPSRRCRRSRRSPRAGRSTRSAPGGITSYSPGKWRQTRSRVARKLAVRASSRPKKSSTNRRATWVESTRSVAAWKVPTFSAREWRSAADDALGANGSCTCTKSNGAVVEHGLDRARDVDRDGHAAAARGRARSGRPPARARSRRRRRSTQGRSRPA